jgi:glycosyltransferase involved in cell wall biosynthesis
MNLSIVIPTYNRSSLLSEAVDSILHHEPPVYEIVIVDDGSTDDTSTECDLFLQRKSSTQIVVVRQEKNLGAQKARNRGLEAATGNLVMFMDSDDVLAMNGVRLLLNRFQEYPNLDFVYGKVVKTDCYLRPLEKILPIGEPFSAAPRDVAGYHWHTMGAIYRKEYLAKVGPWNEELTGSQDWEFQARVKLSKGLYQFVDHVVGYWRDHDELRIGAKSFRCDYVESVAKACLEIHQKAVERNVLDAELERRLIKKLLLHAIEFSVNNHFDERNKYMCLALKRLVFNPFLKIFVYLLAHLSPRLDCFIWNKYSSRFNSV